MLYSGDAYSGQMPKVVLYDLGRDKYFRLLASVKVGDIDIAEYMTLTVGRRLERGLAKKYEGAKRFGNIFKYIHYKINKPCVS